MTTPTMTTNRGRARPPSTPHPVLSFPQMNPVSADEYVHDEFRQLHLAKGGGNRAVCFFLVTMCRRWYPVMYLVTIFRSL